jgi:D-glycero-alpha-D-manno-heptose-7-phosphate kinase
VLLLGVEPFQTEAGHFVEVLGGRISGAGGGGFFLLCVPSGKRAAVRAALRELREMPFRLERGGSRVVLNMQRY